ncbi:MAG: cytochrome c-type biogenesis protein [Pseudomonadota bacterium]
MSARAAAVAALLVLALPGAGLAIDTGPAFDDPAKQARYQRLISEVRCLTCQNQTIKDSNSLLAADLRREIREQMEAGRSDAEIYAFLTARYGEFALYKTPFNARTWIIWLAPPLLLIAGVVAFVSIVRRRARIPLDDEA